MNQKADVITNQCVLAKGIHSFALPLNRPLPIEDVFPREISGSHIESMDSKGIFRKKSNIFFEHGRFKVNDAYRVLHPMQVIRLNLKRDLVLNWKVGIDFHSKLEKPLLHPATDPSFSFEKAFYFMQLCKLAYDNEADLKRVLQRDYDFDDVFYFSRTTAHRRLSKNNYLRLFYLFYRSRAAVMDLQFVKLIRLDEKTDRHTVLIVFKGSKEAEDWVTNFSFNSVDFIGNEQVHVHKGFQQALKVFLRATRKHEFRLEDACVRLHENELTGLNKHARIIFTGHSLGGAIATLAACYFFDKGVHPENLEVYTYGAPPVGMADFVEHYEGKFSIYRIVNEMDIVPRLTGVNPKLRHLSEPIVLPSNNGEIHSPNGYLDNLLDALAGNRMQ